MTLEERDKRVLALIGTQVRPISDLAAALDTPAEELEDRLADLTDMGLVYDRGDGHYERTESGRRVLITSAEGAIDERIDTAPKIEQTIEKFDLRADEVDAVRHAFTFLRYWGRATAEEIVDAIYSEVPAGRETPEEWWEKLVCSPLAALPTVEQPTEDGGPWRYTGTPEAGEQSANGRRVLSETHPAHGDSNTGSSRSSSPRRSVRPPERHIHISIIAVK